MSHETLFEAGRPGRLVAIRLKPNQDLVEGIELAAAEAGLGYATVRSAVGSLVDAALGYGADEHAGVTTVEGPGIEILTLSGELRADREGRPRAHLQGTVADGDAVLYGGRFVRGANPIGITLELVLQEWLPEDDESGTEDRP
ncbi:Predicted DNA-binding protein with PD1-like DNA-binding motif [Tistlia consotensis]|uniref:Predicted DNA-binding protein with PD1-like DNA-binding motif n=1 Tax=Tistlia consotensis USBA 355 TaxID=560819 RepID=A0A1Y6C4L9_9PROT|nr:PPC domain-containing DNA-binding protein [Tistlia consotensis]SMF45477.1 Predicted DNA-binding protein with PD1-like DNA-binding motif [Tistlia consotensis USBA 355]SNR79834.1 Predicted DNA-binding protein with PD1-like DNA-binding motif [Tistlia consotensis]